MRTDHCSNTSPIGSASFVVTSRDKNHRDGKILSRFIVLKVAYMWDLELRERIVTGEWRKLRKWELLSSARTAQLVAYYSLVGSCSVIWGTWEVHTNWSEIRKWRKRLRGKLRRRWVILKWILKPVYALWKWDYLSRGLLFSREGMSCMENVKDALKISTNPFKSFILIYVGLNNVDKQLDATTTTVY